MTPTITAVAILLGAYLLGAIPFGLLIARSFANVDVREKGSGNIGATNVARTAGKKLGIITLALDAAKGAAPVLIADRVLEQPIAIVAAAGFAAVVGHVFPIYLGFKGGKGVATGAGVFFAIAPISTLVAAAVFLASYAIAKVVSLGSLLGCIALVASLAIIDARREVLLLAIAVVLLIILRHKGNIERLLKRTENKL
jgi:glycerol-3-phosphate acyltransferase PlsY